MEFCIYKKCCIFAALKFLIVNVMGIIKNITGTPAEGVDFFGRIKEIEQAIEWLEDGNNLILAAPRRVGKSSFSRKLIEEMISKGWKGYNLNLEKLSTESDFVKHFLREIKGENWWTKYVPEKLGISVKDFSIEFNKQKQDIYREIEKELPHNERTLIVLDELTVFLENALKKEEVKKFLEWLRGLRQESHSKIRWIFCSSISIEHFTHKQNLSHTINDFTPFKLAELKGDEPYMLIKALSASKNIQFSDEHIKYMLEKLGWHLPFFIQILFKEIVELVRDGNVLSCNTIDIAYQNLLSSELYFYRWTERLISYGDEKRLAYIILNELSRVKNGKRKGQLYDLVNSELNDVEKTDEIFKPLLKLLETDGYVINNNDKYSFRSPLLRDYWYNQFGK
jgi:hypothetical protein